MSNSRQVLQAMGVVRLTNPVKEPACRDGVSTSISAHLSLLLFQRACAFCPFMSCARVPDRDRVELTFSLGSRNNSFHIHRTEVVREKKRERERERKKRPEREIKKLEKKKKAREGKNKGPREKKKKKAREREREREREKKKARRKVKKTAQDKIISKKPEREKKRGSREKERNKKA